MEMKKYFEMVDSVRSLRARLNQLNKEWSETVCWYGTPEQQETHNELENLVRNRLNELEEKMKEARKDISKETLKEWKQEYEKLQK
jgi:hypothetical protein